MVLDSRVIFGVRNYCRWWNDCRWYMVARAAKNTGGGLVACALMVARVGSFMVVEWCQEEEWLLMVKRFPVVKWFFLLEWLVVVE